MQFYFQTLIIWQKAFELTKLIYALIRSFPKEEQYALVDQMKRAAVSIMSNIAEWSGRSTVADRNHFYTMAKSSAMELASQILLAKDIWYITDTEKSDKCLWFIEEIMKMTYSLTQK
jgi:four helix bundle protein